MKILHSQMKFSSNRVHGNRHIQMVLRNRSISKSMWLQNESFDLKEYMYRSVRCESTPAYIFFVVLLHLSIIRQWLYWDTFWKGLVVQIDAGAFILSLVSIISIRLTGPLFYRDLKPNAGC